MEDEHSTNGASASTAEETTTTPCVEVEPLREEAPTLNFGDAWEYAPAPESIKLDTPETLDHLRNSDRIRGWLDDRFEGPGGLRSAVS